jgi:hypothetical protein
MRNKSTPKPNTYEMLEPDVIDSVCKLIDEWNELARIYPDGPKYYHVRRGVKPVKYGEREQERTIPANRMPPIIIAIYEFIKDNADWQELWKEVVTAVRESAFLQGKTESMALRPSLGWIFMQSKIHGMQGEYKYKGMELIISGKYAGGVEERPQDRLIDVSKLSKEDYAALIEKQEAEREERKKVNG